MKEIKINKQPFSHFTISDDLEKIKFYIDVEFKNFDLPQFFSERKAFVAKQTQALQLIRPEKGEHGFISTYKNIVELSGFNIAAELLRLTQEHPEISRDFWEYGKLEAKGYKHTFQFIIDKLFDDGYLDLQKKAEVDHFISEKISESEIEMAFRPRV
jgi:hypothetical protein